MDAYRRALASGDIDELFPFLDEGVWWWSGGTGDRIRSGLRDTLTGFQNTPPTARAPGLVWVFAYGVDEAIGYDIDWVHRADLPAQACPAAEPCARTEALHMAVLPGGVVSHGVRSLTSDLRDAGDADEGDLDRIERRYEEIAVRLSSGDAEAASEMISDRAVWQQTADGYRRIDPRQQWIENSAAAFSGTPDAVLEPLTTADLGFEGSPVPAVFFTPAEGSLWYREPTIGGIGVYRWTPDADATFLVVVMWLEQIHGIVDLVFKLQPSDFGVVVPDEANPWMTDPALWPQVPSPSHVMTGTIETSDSTIRVFNGSESQQDLLEWVLELYTGAGLPAPVPHSVAFPPSADCILYAGLAVDTGDGVDLQLCFSQKETCTDEACTPSVGAQSTMLHELGHVWTIQQVDEATRTAFLDLRGLETWSGTGVIRDYLGTEHAAEILAWGLLEVDSVPARLPDNECADLAAAFEILTGVAPPRTCP
jgi:hypothetical protein